MKKKLKLTDQEALTEDYQLAAGDLAEAIVENLKEQQDVDLEPFELYTQRVKTKIHSNLDIFRRRFLRGYKILIQEVAKDIRSSTDSQDSGKKQ